MFLQVLLRVLPSSDLWQSTLQFAALLLLPALAGVISERSGVVNIAMEGMMLTGAYAGVMTALATHNVIMGVIGAMVAGKASGRIFIENGRFHGQVAIDEINARRRGPTRAG